MERFEFTPTPNFRVTDIEAEIERHLIFDIDVFWEVEDWSFLENQNGTLDYNEFDNLQEAREFYFYNIDDVFEIRGKNHNGYYSIYNENIFYKKIF